MQSPEVREIDGHSWTVVKFTGRESLALFRRLTALAAEPIADAIMTASKSVSPGEDIDVTTILAVAGGAIGLAGKVSSKLTDDGSVAAEYDPTIATPSRVKASCWRTWARSTPRWTPGS